MFPLFNGVLPAAERGGARVTVWDGPGGDVAASPDYEVVVSSGSKVFKPFTYYSFARPVDKLLDTEGNYTVWQLANAEPLWIRNPDGCVVDGLQVIAFNAWPTRQTIDISRGTVKNSVFKNFRSTTGTLSPASVLRIGEDATTKLRCHVYAVYPLESYHKLGGRQIP